MVDVVFVAPFLMRATLQFINGVAGLSDVRLKLISQDSTAKIPPDLRARLAAHQQIGNGLDPDSIEKAVRASGRTDRLLGTLEHLQVPLARVRERLGIAGMDVETAKNFRDKSRMKTLFRAKGLPCARHCLATSPEAAAAFGKEVGFPLVVKPPEGAGSRNTFQINYQSELDSYLSENMPTRENPTLFEEFIMGNEHTFESVCINGRMVWHSITRYFPTPLQVLKNPGVQWCIILPREIDHPHFDDIRDIGARALNALGMRTGLSHLEWFRRVDGSIAVSEIGARPPGGQLTSMTGFAHDFDIHRAWARLMVFGRFDPPPRKFATGTVFLRGRGPGRVRAIHGWNRIRETLGPIIAESKMPQIGQSGSGTYEGEGYLILRHPQTSVIEKALDLILTTIHIEMA